jgi:hypothetical protein
MKLRWLVKHRTLTANDVLEAKNKTGESNSRCLERLKAENKPTKTLQVWCEGPWDLPGYWEDVPTIVETT